MTDLANPDPGCNGDTEPELVLIHGPTWTEAHPWDVVSANLVDWLERNNWRVKRAVVTIHVISPFLKEA